MNDQNLENGKGTQFKPGQSGNLKGRKPSRLKQFIKEYDVTKEDINILFKNLIFNYTPSQLVELLKKKDNKKENDDLPAGVAALISGILHDIKRGDMKVFNLILDRVYGKSKESLNVFGGVDIIANMDPKERDIRLKELLDKCEI